MGWQPSHADPPELLDTADALEATEKFWADWVSQCTCTGPYRSAVVRC